MTGLLPPLLAAVALGSACAVLSVFVILRRWAFIGEGISHSGLAGAGTVWLLALAFPALEHPAAAYIAIVLAALLTTFAIGYFSRANRLNPDTAIGIFLVASLAWGFLAREIYIKYQHREPAGWDNFLLGQLLGVSSTYAIVTVLLCGAVIAIVVLLNKELLLYSFDPVAAEVSGIRAGLIHYLLMTLVWLTIVLGIRIAGPLLVPALLVLPGATALLISMRLKTVFTVSILTGLIGTVGGLFLNHRYALLPAGPCIVLLLFLTFLGSYVWSKLQPATRPGP
jgi:manganese/iron transport system permease protein